jgi:threonine synthase
MEAYKQLQNPSKVVFSVPSGNFGNLTAGLFAKKMGLPVHHFIAATNINDVVPKYLKTGQYHPVSSFRTLSNAMDVGNPSNFVRIKDMCSTWNVMNDEISGFAYDDDETKKGMIEVKDKYGYVIEPHGAVGYLALKEWQKKNPNSQGIVLETAHPAKFLEDVEGILNEKVDIPVRLAILSQREKESILTTTNFELFKLFLLENYK